MNSPGRLPGAPATPPRPPLALLLALLVAPPLRGGCGGDVDLEATGALLAEWSEAPAPPPPLAGPPGLAPTWESVADFYSERDGRPLWLDERGLSRRGRALVAALCDAGERGLDPAHYGLTEVRDLRLALRGPAASARDSVVAAATLEASLTAALVAHASDLATGLVEPSERGAEVHLRGRPLEPRALLESVAARAGVSELLASLMPQDRRYRALAREAERLSRTVADGGWGALPEGPYRPGDEGPGIAGLRRRLAAGGDLPRDADGGRRFDAAVARAVRRFQARHGLDTTGVVDPATVAALNVPARERLETVRTSLERWRWLPRRLGRLHVLVNLPSFTLDVVAGGRPALTMPVVVGASYRGRATPLFADTMTAIEFSPHWYVPKAIALEEILPKARRDPGFLARNGFELVPGPEGPGGEPVFAGLPLPSDGPATASADDDGADAPTRLEDAVAAGRVALRQRPGPSNALGGVKFLFPNQHAIYFHDTPERELFRRATRAFSHGCIRLSRPARLAQFCLAPAGWDRERVERAMASGEPHRVRLPRPLPVYIAYFTAFVDREGRLNFRDDVYGWDAQLQRALRPHAPPPGAGGAASEACRDLLEG